MDNGSYIIGITILSVFGICALIMLVYAVVAVISYWRIFEKAGYEGWRALVPFYSQYTFFELTIGCGWLFLLLLVPMASVAVTIIARCKLADIFGCGLGTTLLLVFIPIVGLPVVAFGDNHYIAEKAVL